MCGIIFYFISFSLYPNLVFRHFIPHFPPKSAGIACWLAELNAVLCLDTGAKKMKI